MNAIRTCRAASASSLVLRFLAVAATVLLGCVAVGVPAASAGKPVHDTFGTQGSGPGQFAAFVTGVAVDQATGDVLAANSGGDARVQRFDAAGNFLGQFGAAELSQPGLGVPFIRQIAVGPDGSVYVADTANNRVAKFTAGGVFDSAIGVSGPGALASPRGVAVASDGSVYVADTDNNRVVVFGSSGVYDSEFASSDLVSPVSVAVDSLGAVYVIDGAAPDSGFGRLQRFDSTGALDPGFAFTEFVSYGLTVDSTNDHVFTSTSPFLAFGGAVAEVDSSGAVVDVHAPSGGYTAWGLALRQGGGPIYVASADGGSVSENGRSILVLDEPAAPAPTAEIDPVTTPGATTATISGTVNPNGDVGLDWAIEISSDGGSSWELVDSGQVLEGNSPVAVDADATGLAPNAPYDVRLTAEKPYGLGTDQHTTSFSTDTAPPIVRVLAAGFPTDTAVWLGADVNPSNQPTSYEIEYTLATDTGYTSSLRVPAAPAEVGDDNTFHTVTQLVTGLQPDTAYRFRVVAENPTGETVGSERTFKTRTTLPEPPAGRGYEMVTPLDKNGGGVDRNSILFDDISTVAVAPSGDGVAYGSYAAFANPQGINALSNQYRSSRISTGWTTRALSPPLEPVFVETPVGNATWVRGLSADLSRAAVTTNKPLTASARTLLGDSYGLYLEEYTAAAPTYQLISHPVTPLPPEVGGENTAANRFRFGGANSDMSSVAFMARGRPLLPDAEPYAPNSAGVYQWTDGLLHFVSVLPDGNPADVAVPGARGSNQSDQFTDYPGDHLVSDDSSRVFFTAFTESVSEGRGSLYVHERTDSGGVTTLLSGSERTGDNPDTPLAGTFQAAKADDGSLALFTSPRKLTNDATAPDGGGCSSSVNACDLYLWDANAPSGARLTDLTSADPDGGGVLGIAGAAKDLSHIYFVANGQLATGAIDGNCVFKIPVDIHPEERCNLYAWTAPGEIAHVAVLSGADSSVWAVNRTNSDKDATFGGMVSEPVFRNARIAADGSRLLFESSNRLTSFENAGRAQVYLYDARDDELRCVSCSSSVSTAVSSARLYPISDPVAPDIGPIRLPQNLSADGSRAFFQSDRRFVSEDVNGVADVYMWEDGEISLVTSGQGRFPSEFIGASASGDDVFFTTRQRLVGSDVDSQSDIYDARVGGGFAEQELPPECLGDDCQGGPSGRPGAVVPGSRTLAGGDGDASRRRAFSSRSLTAGQRLRLASGRPVVLRVRVSHAGRVTAIAKARFGKRTHTVASATTIAVGAGTVTLRLRLTAAARGWVARTGRLRATLSVRFAGVRQRKRATLNLRSPRDSSRSTTTQRRASR